MGNSNEDYMRLFKSTTELLDPEEVTIKGTIPQWLKGTFLRVGPGKFDMGDFTMKHWLDGYGILTKFEINDSKVKFTKKFLDSNAHKRMLKLGKPAVTEFATRGAGDNSKGLFFRFVSSLFPIEMTDNDSISLFKIGNDIFSTTDTNFFRRIDPVSLNALELYDTNKCYGMQSSVCHPIEDHNGDIYSIGFTFGPGLKFNIVRVPAGGKRSGKEMLANTQSIAQVPSRFKGSIAFTHSFGMSKNYIVFIEQPLFCPISKIAASVINGTAFIDWLNWLPKEKNKFYLIEKSTGKVLKVDYFSSEAFFFLHVINCYEDDNKIVIDVNGYPSPAMIDCMYLDRLRSNMRESIDPPSPQRFVIPILNDVKEMDEGLNDEGEDPPTAIRKGNKIILHSDPLTKVPGLECPILSRKFFGKKYSYFYGAGTVCFNDCTNSLCKVDVASKDTLFWKESEFNYPGEPQFIRNPDGNAEDDGCLISAVTTTKRRDEKNDSSQDSADDFLVFLDAKTMKEIGRATFKNHVPQACHGIFLSEK